MYRLTRYPGSVPNTLRAHARTSSMPLRGGMRLVKASALGIALGLSLLVTMPALVTASESSNKAVDAMFLRPLGAFRLLFGSVLMVPASVFNLAGLPFQGGEIYKESAEIFILEPYRYTFQRPLGENLEGG